MNEHYTHSTEWVDHLYKKAHPVNRGSLINDIAFLWITKNCSSFFRSVEQDNIDCAKHNKIVAILRDPIDRYISGLTQWQKVNNISNTEWQQQAEEGIVYFDEHTIPQNKFLENISGRVDFFYYNKDVITQINAAYNLGFTNTIVNATTKNIAIEDYLTRNTQYFKLVKEKFEQDYILLDSVEWRNK